MELARRILRWYANLLLEIVETPTMKREWRLRELAPRSGSSLDQDRTRYVQFPKMQVCEHEWVVPTSTNALVEKACIRCKQAYFLSELAALQPTGTRSFSDTPTGTWHV